MPGAREGAAAGVVAGAVAAEGGGHQRLVFFHAGNPLPPECSCP